MTMPKNALALLANFLIPGIGSVMIGLWGQGLFQFVIWALGLILVLTTIGAIIGFPLMVGAWIWGLILVCNFKPAATTNAD